MPKVKTADSPLCFKKGLSEIDKKIVQLILELETLQRNIDIAQYQYKQLQEECNDLYAQIHATRERVRKKNAELYDLFHSKVWVSTVAYNR